MLTDDQVKEKIKEIEDLEMLKKQEEKKFEKLIRQVESKLTQVEHDKNIWAIKLKEKEQELKLNELRIKELKRQVPHKALKPLPNKENSKQQKKRTDRRAELNDKLKKNATETNPKKQKTTKNTSVDSAKEAEVKAKPKMVDRADDEEKNANDADDNGPSRLSENNSKKDGFYENSFQDDNSDPDNRDNSPEVKQAQSNAKSKPFDFGAKKNQDTKRKVSQDDEGKDGNTFITGKK